MSLSGNMSIKNGNIIMRLKRYWRKRVTPQIEKFSLSFRFLACIR